MRSSSSSFLVSCTLLVLLLQVSGKSLGQLCNSFLLCFLGQRRRPEPKPNGTFQNCYRTHQSPLRIQFNCASLSLSLSLFHFTLYLTVKCFCSLQLHSISFSLSLPLSSSHFTLVRFVCLPSAIDSFTSALLSSTCRLRPSPSLLLCHPSQLRTLILVSHSSDRPRLTIVSLSSVAITLDTIVGRSHSSSFLLRRLLTALNW
jgi:hypothetical protein